MSESTVIVVDDDAAIRTVVRQALLREGHAVRTTDSAAGLWKLVEEGVGDVVVTDVLLPDANGLDLVPLVAERRPGLPVIVMSAQNTLTTAVKATERGAFEYLPKPFDLKELAHAVASALAGRRRPLRPEPEPLPASEAIPMIGRSPAMQDVYRTIARVVPTDLTVMVLGESGTGKELVARAIHFNGARRSGPFVAVDCAAIPEDLLESELFGHEKGAFTDATAQRLGKFEMAHGGTLMLDEIGNMARAMQAKLLRALETREIQRVGGARLIPVDVRIIAATNMDLRSAIQRGDFREDLYYRLNVVNIHVPPLRERRGDIPELIRHFMTLFNARFGKKVEDISPETMRVLQAYSWPGNVRELRNIIERMVALAKTNRLEHDMLPLDILFSDAVDDRGTPAPDVPAAHGDSLRTARERFEREFILKVLERVRFNVTRAAKLLGVHRNTLMAKMESYGLGKDSHD